MMHSIKEALDLILAQAKDFGCEEVSINDAFNRVLAEDIYADRDYPPFNRSAMDGYAVCSSDFSDKKLHSLVLIDKLFAGNIATKKVTSGTCIKIMTGAPVPEGADAVIRVEDSIENNDRVEFKTEHVSPLQNIASQAEDAVKGALIIKKNVLLNALTIPVLAVVGRRTVKVSKLPAVVVASTGNEIVSVEDAIKPHQIRDSNSYALKNFFKSYMINSVNTIRVPDNKIILKEMLKNYLNVDILMLSGGVSKGDADYVPEVLVSLGVRELFHRVRIKPGSPLWFGRMPNGGVVFGLPGNPVAVQVAFKVFIEPYLRTCFNLEPVQPIFLPLNTEKNKKTKFDEYFPCTVSTKNKSTGLLPTRMNGSGDIAATAGSDGIAIHPADMDKLDENTVLEFYYW